MQGPAPNSAPAAASTEAAAAPPRPPRLAQRLARPFIRFLELEVASAALLLFMSAVALVWANSPWAHAYFALWNKTYFGVSLGAFQLQMSLGHWVNDALMAVFFFAVGMEIKREMVLGELSTRSKAMLPVLAAVGGMVVPALIYYGMHAGGPAARGWGIPMATDIAFALAAMSVLGKRVPAGLRVFLLALAIADDLGAVTVIALFYTAELNLHALLWAGGGLGACVLLRLAGVRSLLVYGVVGAFVWLQTHHSGVHATIAGVALGLLTPTTPARVSAAGALVEGARAGVEKLGALLAGGAGGDHHGHERHRIMQVLRGAGRESLSPLDYLCNLLERPVAFIVMPVFAFANAGVALDAGTLGNSMAQQVAVAVAAGLFFGKPVGVAAFAWLAVRLRVAELPAGVNWGMVFATGLLAGIGFTVALFVTALAFTDPVHTAGSKIGILAGSAAAAVFGLWLLKYSLPAKQAPH